MILGRQIMLLRSILKCVKSEMGKAQEIQFSFNLFEFLLACFLHYCSAIFKVLKNIGQFLFHKCGYITYRNRCFLHKEYQLVLVVSFQFSHSPALTLDLAL